MVSGKRIVFWDFDGVIKDSVVAKAVAFEQLFLPFGRSVAERVRLHHEANTGVSRYEKIPLYLAWAGEPAPVEQVAKFCDRFSDLVRRGVLESDWVPGVREYLLEHHARQDFVLVTATPQAEIEEILVALAIFECFREIHGSPKKKQVAIADVLKSFRCRPKEALMIGDSVSDFAAAAANQVPFLLRRTALNHGLQDQHAGQAFDDFERLIRDGAS